MSPSRTLVGTVLVIVCAIGVSESFLAIVGAAERGIATVLNDVLPPDRRITPDTIEQDRQHVAPVIRSRLTASLVYMYRDAPVEDIERYAQTLESELDRWFTVLQRDTSARAAESIAETAMRRILDARRTLRRT